MNIIEKIDAVENVTLISIHGAKSETGFISAVFEAFRGMGINVDMISFAASPSSTTILSFSVADADLNASLKTIEKLKSAFPGIKPTVSSGNTKVSVFGEGMKTVPGVASKFFSTLSDAGVGIMLITTSETDISVLLPASDTDTVIRILK